MSSTTRADDMLGPSPPWATTVNSPTSPSRLALLLLASVLPSPFRRHVRRALTAGDLRCAILIGQARTLAPSGLRRSAVCKLFPVLSFHLRFSLTVVFATAFSILVANGQVTSAEAADEPAGPPSPYARTAFAYGISKTEAVLIGFVNARGSSTTARFQVGRTKSYGRWFPAGQPEEFYSGRHSSEVEQGVDRLRPRTTYHFRLVATNEGGTTYGKDKTFWTLPR
jgi:hypothetical protein